MFALFLFHSASNAATVSSDLTPRQSGVPSCRSLLAYRPFNCSRPTSQLLCSNFFDGLDIRDQECRLMVESLSRFPRIFLPCRRRTLNRSLPPLNDRSSGPPQICKGRANQTIRSRRGKMSPVSPREKFVSLGWRFLALMPQPAHAK